MATNTPRLPGENERAASLEPEKSLRGIVTDMAIRSGAMTDAGELSDEMFDFGKRVVEHCASLAEGGAGDDDGSAAASRIRALLGSGTGQ